jgi:hypothetical protein
MRGSGEGRNGIKPMSDNLVGAFSEFWSAESEWVVSLIRVQRVSTWSTWTYLDEIFINSRDKTMLEQ